MLDIKRLIDAGAKNILIMGLPDLSYFPGFTADFSPHKGIIFAQLLKSINNGFMSSILTWPTDVDDLNLKFFDTMTLFNTIFSDPQRYSLTNITSPCLENWQNFGRRGATGEGIPKICQEPDKFFFWDGWHPTTYLHSIIAREVMNFLNWSK